VLRVQLPEGDGHDLTGLRSEGHHEKIRLWTTVGQHPVAPEPPAVRKYRTDYAYSGMEAVEKMKRGLDWFPGICAQDVRV
jgi:hypothetical protein